MLTQTCHRNFFLMPFNNVLVHTANTSTGNAWIQHFLCKIWTLVYKQLKQPWYCVVPIPKCGHELLFNGAHARVTLHPEVVLAGEGEHAGHFFRTPPRVVSPRRSGHFGGHWRHNRRFAIVFCPNIFYWRRRTTAVCRGGFFALHATGCKQTAQLGQG